MLIDGSWVDSAVRRGSDRREPGQAQTDRRRSRAATQPTSNGAVEAAATRLSRLEQGRAARARPAAAAHRRGDGGPRSRSSRALIALETGNALRTQARGEATADGRHLPLFRRPGRRAEGRDHPARRAGAELYAARAARRRRRDHPVERAGAARRAEDRARALRRQHAGAEGGRGRAARRAADGRRSARSSCRPAC